MCPESAMPVKKLQVKKITIFFVGVLICFQGLAVSSFAASPRKRVSGRTKRIATPKNQAALKTITTYIIKRGDTLFSIARNHGTSSQNLMALNNLKSTRLRVGQALRLNSRGADSKAEVSSEPRARAELAAALKVERKNPFSFLDPAPKTGEETAPAEVLAEISRTDGPSAFGRDIASNDLSTRRFQLVSAGFEYLGVRYRWRGTSVKTGFDCSGLVAKLFDQFGINLPHSAREQFKLGVKISAKELQVGDLVFFSTRNEIATHVGIYIGENCILHAMSGVHKVTVSHLDHTWYKNRFLGARRIPELWASSATSEESEMAQDGAH